MVSLRLARHGSKKAPFYRVVATDVRNPRDGRYIEILGTYDPRVSEGGLNLKSERIQHWISQGAQPTDTVARLIRTARKAAAADA